MLYTVENTFVCSFRAIFGYVRGHHRTRTSYFTSFALPVNWSQSKYTHTFNKSPKQFGQMSLKVQKITEPLLLGEGPHWDDRQQALFFVSIRENTIHKYVPDTGEHTETKLQGRVGFIIPVEGTTDQFVIGLERQILVVQWDGKTGSDVKTVKALFDVDQDKPKNRLNDAKVDFRGRLYAGTMGNEEPIGTYEPGAGSLYCVEGDKKIAKLASGIGISNGLAWDLDAKAMYYVDSLERNMRRYDYDVETGMISNKKYIFDLVKNGLPGYGDGATIDIEGNLWLAVYDQSCVAKIDPNNGKLLQKVEIPARQVTSVTFGGPNLDILFVTTASMPIKEEQKPPSGSVFMVTGLGVKGHPNRNFKL